MSKRAQNEGQIQNKHVDIIHLYIYEIVANKINSIKIFK